ncbi:MAG TPA: PAS domain S-box protein [Burkholderiaceae bacterium]|nr:PAS domain S-box protein [Burkholderiaceae bacterium]
MTSHLTTPGRSAPSPAAPAHPADAGRRLGVARACRSAAAAWRALSTAVSPIRRALPWVALVALLLVAQGALWWLTRQHESSRAQEAVEAAATAAAAEMGRGLARDTHLLQALLWQVPAPGQWTGGAQGLLRERRELMRIELRAPDFTLQEALTSPYHATAFRMVARNDADAIAACQQAARQAAPWFSRTYFVPLGDGTGSEVVDVCVPWRPGGASRGWLLGTLVLAVVMEQDISADVLRNHEVSLVEPDGTRLARSGLRRGAGLYVAEHLVDLAGLRLPLRVDSVATGPYLIPTLATSLVLGLSLALAAVVMLLVRDVRRRAGAERRLAEALAFRRAMEDSLVTGLRARDLQGTITYVNPAFCAMVGFRAEELVGQQSPPYWPPELLDEYAQRQTQRQAGDAPSSDGFETLFMRRDGERFPVRIFEAPLVDGSGRHTGWMSAVLDVGEQRRAEEFSRQQQERLQATARLATLGEMASLLSHELNQPLAAIASYAAGTLNLMPPDDPQDPPELLDPGTQALIRQAMERVAEQAERAGRVIKSVHDFVRRRGQLRERVPADHLIESVLPLVRLAARKSGTRIEVDVATPVSAVTCDRTMVEQVILNLARNAIQAMEEATPQAERTLGLRVRSLDGKRVSFSVADLGPGITPEVAQRLFTPFFTTKPDGMGLGLSLCRTVIEQHGGTLSWRSPLTPAGGTEFLFTLAASP